jgi:hypothetical protein
MKDFDGYFEWVESQPVWDDTGEKTTMAAVAAYEIAEQERYNEWLKQYEHDKEREAERVKSFIEIATGNRAWPTFPPFSSLRITKPKPWYKAPETWIAFCAIAALVVYVLSLIL